MKFFILFLCLFVNSIDSFIGCDFKFSTEDPVKGPYACFLQSNQTVLELKASNLSGLHSEFMSDFDVTFVAIRNLTVRDIPSEMFQRFQNVENFACIDTTLNTLKYQYFSKATQLKNLWIFGNKIDKIEQGFLRDSSKTLEILILSSNRLANLQRNFLGELNNLHDLYLDGNFLTSLRNETFNGLRFLDRLILTSNKIMSIETNAFDGLEKLQILYLDNNQITRLENNVLQPLKRLHKLSLNYNFISVLDDDLFAHSENLAFLEVSHNRLQFISFLHILKKLECLDISYNQIDAIGKFDISESRQFTTLLAVENLCININISHNLNSTKSLDDCFKNYRIPNCKYFFDQQNGLTCEIVDSFELNDDLPIGTNFKAVNFLKIRRIKKAFSFPLLVKKFPKLTKAFIQNTNLPYVMQQTLECTELTHVDIRFNAIRKLTESFFANCHKLKEIILIKNDISEIPKHFFDGPLGVETVDLSFNILTSLEFLQENFKSLKKLSLSKNLMSMIPKDSFRLLSNLRILKLNDNKISAIHKMAFASTPSLRELHLQHNGIESTSFLSVLEKLIYLNLEGNRLTSISFNGLPNNLQYIDVSFNSIEKIDVNELDRLERLNDLFLIRNKCVDTMIADIKLESKNVYELLQDCIN